MRVVFALILAILVGYGVFARFPSLDLTVSRKFFDGKEFWVQLNPNIELVRLVLYAAEDIASLAALGLGLWASWRKRAILQLAARDWYYGFAVFALGPGLLVNGILKPAVGRARPWQVTEFGGAMQFTQPWQLADQLASGRSFVSGEMAGATALALLMAMILRANREIINRGAYGLGVVLTLFVPIFTAWQRIASGRHFLSDVVFAALFVTLLACLLSLMFYGRANPLRPVDILGDSS